MDQLRQTILSDMEIIASKSRFGLFSQPPPLAIGDNSVFKQKRARRGQDSKPITKPRNMLPGPNRSGVDKKAFIDPPESVHVGDSYLDPQKVDYKYYTKFHTRSTIHELQFKPSDGRKEQAVTPYKHIDQNPKPKQRPLRNQTGRIITKERNVQSNPMHKVHTDLFKFPKYVSDPINRKQQMQSKQRKLSRKKMPPQMMRTMSHGDILFFNDKDTFGFDQKAKELITTRRSPFVQTAPRKYRHETNFKLARRGHGDPIGKYPEFLMPSTDAKTQLVKTARKQKNEKQEWKPNGNRSISRPTPTISYSSMNLRKMM